MKIGPVTLPALDVPRLGPAAFSRRIVVHGVFLALAIATLALALVLLTEERQRSHQRYEQGFRKTLGEITAQLRHPAGQLALLNPGRGRQGQGALAPMLLPFAALDFDDPLKAQQAVEMAGCALRYADGSALCAAVGSNAYAGGFIYLVGQLAAGPLQPRPRGGLELDEVHRARVTLQMRGSTAQWIAPYEAIDDKPAGVRRGRLAGFVGAGPHLEARALPVRDFRGWVWQQGDCMDAGVAPNVGASVSTTTPASQTDAATCPRRTLVSVRLPVEAYREALFQTPRPAWPPADLDQTQLRLELLGPGGTVVFDSAAARAAAPYSLDDLTPVLGPGEVLRIQQLGGTGRELAIKRGAAPADEASAPWLMTLIRRLPVPGEPAQLSASDTVVTSVGRYQLTLTGDQRSVDRSLAATASRLSWFVGAMLAAIALAWALVELGLMRRVAVLTRRAAAVSYNMQDPQVERRMGELDVSDLRGPDELGILAGGLADLLQRVKDSMKREHIRAERELDQWHAVGHEIMSPLQSLMVLHGDAADPSHRYVQRMQQAVRVLYGTASPSEAIESATLQTSVLDLNEFVRVVAANAHFAGIANVRFEPAAQPMPVRADEYPLEDAVTHVLRNADRHRAPGTPITLSLQADEPGVRLDIHNVGPQIAPEIIERIFDYGVSDQEPAPQSITTGERRGQGLFVARTYMAKMGGTIGARNVADGVVFTLTFQRSA